ncbi:MAG: UDP-2,4-diacetamido-2,4,6-trideoxy-beta-L-altropyranose hydrolase [Candidatus Sericytochromatia bacterium]|nr:UDP-2,4-diacetamido-2,4,6-trideoxy-beta-L-altropyranose hydrolase [Candidatus Tanganyikabacteria bacterium]
MAKIALRVDASHVLGTGHLMRCLVLARTLRHRGCEVLMISRSLPGHLCDWVERTQDIRVARLPATAIAGNARPESGALGCSEEEDAAETRGVLEDSGPWDAMIVDHYGLGAEWERAVAPLVRRMLTIDDLANRPHATRILLDPNFHVDPAGRYRALVPEDCLLLLGPRFAPLRREFVRHERVGKRTHSGRPRVLVYFGGSDRYGLTLMALRALASLGFPPRLVTVLVGATDPASAAIAREATHLGYPPMTGVGSNMPRLMRQADLALGAGGSTQWERFLMGLPSIVATIAENQEACAEALHQAGYVHLMGRADELTSDDIKRHIRTLWTHPGRRRHLALRGRGLVDGLGAGRVVDALLEDLAWHANPMAAEESVQSVISEASQRG